MRRRDFPGVQAAQDANVPRYTDEDRLRCLAMGFHVVEPDKGECTPFSVLLRRFDRQCARQPRLPH